MIVGNQGELERIVADVESGSFRRDFSFNEVRNDSGLEALFKDLYLGWLRGEITQEEARKRFSNKAKMGNQNRGISYNSWMRMVKEFSGKVRFRQDFDEAYHALLRGQDLSLVNQRFVRGTIFTELVRDDSGRLVAKPLDLEREDNQIAIGAERGLGRKKMSEIEKRNARKSKAFERMQAAFVPKMIVQEGHMAADIFNDIYLRFESNSISKDQAIRELESRVHLKEGSVKYGTWNDMVALYLKNALEKEISAIMRPYIADKTERQTITGLCAGILVEGGIKRSLNNGYKEQALGILADYANITIGEGEPALTTARKIAALKLVGAMRSSNGGLTFNNAVPGQLSKSQTDALGGAMRDLYKIRNVQPGLRYNVAIRIAQNSQIASNPPPVSRPDGMLAALGVARLKTA